MRLAVLIAAFVLLSGSAAAQRYKPLSINTETPEGKLLQSIGTESDEGKKIALMEQFIEQFPKQDAAGYVLSQMQVAYAKAGKHDKVIEAGEKLLVIDGTDLEAAYANLKAAEAMKDSDAVLKWSGTTSEMAKKAVQAPKKDDQSDEEYKHAVDFAKQVDTYTEYSLYAAALGEADPQKVILLATTLEKRNPESQYITQTMPKYTLAARQANALPAAVAYGERAFARGQFNEDLLLAMSDYSMQQKQHDKTITYTNKIVELMNTKQKPEGMGDADWLKKKNTTLGLAYWMQGVTYSGQNRFAQADKALRASLPLIKDTEQLAGPALFHLGLSNYKMAQASKSKTQASDAVNFFRQAAAIKGPLAGQASKNVQVVQKEFGVK